MAIKGASAGIKVGGAASKGASAVGKLEKAQNVMNVAQQGVGVAQSVKGILPGGGGGGGGGGGKDSGKKILGLIILIFVVIFIVMIAMWFMNSGGLQQSAGSQFSAEKQRQAFLENDMMRRIQDWFANPFGIRAAAGEYEQVDEGTQEATTTPEQAFSIELRVTPAIVQYGNPSVTLIITAKNQGSTAIKELALEIFSEHPIINVTDAPIERCFTIDLANFPNLACDVSERDPYALRCTLNNIAPYSSKQLVITGGQVDEYCVYRFFTHSGSQGEFSPDQPTSIFINVRGVTYYPTSSRLSVERIKTDYGTLLIQNELLMQQSRGAIYQTGTAMQIDMDIGEQPILDSVNEGGMIFSWVEVGEGKMDPTKNPFLFLVTPQVFGQCRPSGIGATTLDVAKCDDIEITKFRDRSLRCLLCDDDLKTYWCDATSPVHMQIAANAGTILESFDWACGLMNKGYHVCATNTMNEEFSVMSCTLDLSASIDANRITNYVTALALYPYVVEAPLTTIQAYNIS